MTSENFITGKYRQKKLIYSANYGNQMLPMDARPELPERSTLNLTAPVTSVTKDTWPKAEIHGLSESGVIKITSGPTRLLLGSSK